jgi:hypothetical protein
MATEQPLTLSEILAMEDVGQKISLLQQRTTPAPPAAELYRDWNVSGHAVMNEKLRPNMRVLKKEEVRNEAGTILQAAEYETRKVNRVPVPLEQDIVNIHTSFTVGIPPKLECEPNDDREKELFDIILRIDARNKIKYQNKRVVRSWLSEMEVAEYWYVVKGGGFWRRALSKIGKVVGLSTLPEYELKSMLWSPFRGDTLYPFFDDRGDLLALSRRYKVKYPNSVEIEYFMTVTNEMVYTWRMEGVPTLEKTFRHNFRKLPVIYAYRERELCREVKPIRERIEALLSNFADAIDYHFFPYLILEGDIEGAPQSVGNNKMIKIENGGKAYYLDWNQTPEMIRLEIEGLWEKAYSMTHTPRLSVENLKGLGVVSGTAFRYTFMGAHLAVANHAETIEEFLQRRYNFLVSAVASLNTSYQAASETIEITPQIVPYMIDDLNDKIKAAVAAVDGGIASRKTGVVLAGIIDEVEDELAAIEEEQRVTAGEPTPPKQ